MLLRTSSMSCKQIAAQQKQHSSIDIDAVGGAPENLLLTRNWRMLAVRRVEAYMHDAFNPIWLLLRTVVQERWGSMLP
jgi:hypothetical protein